MRDYKKIYVNSLVRIIEKSGKEVRTLEIPNEKIDAICNEFNVPKTDIFTITTENTVIIVKKKDYSSYLVTIKLL